MPEKKKSVPMVALPSAGFMQTVIQNEETTKFLDSFQTPQDRRQYNNYLTSQEFINNLGISPFKEVGDRRAKFNPDAESLIISDNEDAKKKAFKVMYNKVVAGKGGISSGSFAQRTFNGSMTGGWAKMLGLDKLTGMDDGLSDFSFQKDGVFVDGHKLSLNAVEGKMVSDFASRVLDQDREKSFAEKAAETTVSVLWDLPLMATVGALTSGSGTAAMASARATRGFGALVGSVARNSAMFNIMGIPAYVDAIHTDQKFDVLANLFLHNTALGAGAAITGKLGSMASNKAFSNIAFTKEIMKKNPAFMDAIGALPGSFGFGYGSSKLAGADDQDALATGLAFAAMHFTDVNAYKRMIQQQKTKEIKVLATNYDGKENPVAFSHDYFVEENNQLFKINNEQFKKGKIVKSSDGVEISDEMRKELYYYNEIPEHTRLTYSQALEQVRTQKMGKQLYDRWTKELPAQYVKENGDKLRGLAEITAGSVAVGDLSKLMSKTSLPEDKDLQTSMVRLSEKFNLSYGDIKKHVLNNIGEFFADPEAFKAKYANESKPMQEIAKVVEKAHDAVVSQESNKGFKSRLQQQANEIVSGGSKVVKLEEDERGVVLGGASVEKNIADAKGLLIPKYGEVGAENIIQTMTPDEIKKAAETGEFPKGIDEVAGWTYESKGEIIPVEMTPEGEAIIGNVPLTKPQTDKLKADGKIAKNKPIKIKANKYVKGIDETGAEVEGITLGYGAEDNSLRVKTADGIKIIPAGNEVNEVKKGVQDATKEKVQTAEKIASVPVMMTKQMEVGLKVKGYTQEQIDKLKPSEAWDILKPTQPNVETTSTDVQGEPNVTLADQTIDQTKEINPVAPVDVTKETPTSTAKERPKPEDVVVLGDIIETKGTEEFKDAQSKMDTIAEDLVNEIKDLSPKKKETLKADIEHLLLEASGVSGVRAEAAVTSGKSAHYARSRYNENNKALFSKKEYDRLQEAGILDYIKKVAEKSGRSKITNAENMTSTTIADGIINSPDVQAEIDLAASGDNVNLLTRKGAGKSLARGIFDENTDNVNEPSLGDYGLGIIKPGQGTKRSEKFEQLRTKFEANKFDVGDLLDIQTARVKGAITAKEETYLTGKYYKELGLDKKQEKPSGKAGMYKVLFDVYSKEGLSKIDMLDRAVAEGNLTEAERETAIKDFSGAKTVEEGIKRLNAEKDKGALYNTTNFADQPVNEAETTKTFVDKFGIKPNYHQTIDPNDPTKRASVVWNKDGKLESVNFATLTGKDAPLEETIHVSAAMAEGKIGGQIDKLLKDLGSDGVFGSEEWGKAHERLWEHVAEYNKGYRPDEYGMLSKVKEVWEKLKNFFTGHGMYSSAEIYRKLLDGDMTFSNTARELPPNATTSSLFNTVDKPSEYQKEKETQASDEQWKEIRKTIIPEAIVAENERKMGTFAKNLDHYDSTGKGFWRDISQPLWVMIKMANEKGGYTKELIDKITTSRSVNEGRSHHIARVTNDILDKAKRDFASKATPEEVKNLEDVIQYFNDNKLKVPEVDKLPEFIKNMQDLGKNEYTHYNSHGIASKVVWDKVSDNVWDMLREGLRDNEMNKREIATESIKENLHKDKFITVKKLLQAPTSKTNINRELGRDAFDLMGVEPALGEQLRGIAEAVFANPYVKASEVIDKMPKMAEGHFNDNVMRLDDIKKELNSAAFKKKYTFNTINGKEFDNEQWKSDRKKILSQIKDYQDKIKVVDDVDQLRTLIGRNAEANLANPDETNPRYSVLSLEDLTDKLIGKWESNAGMERGYSEPINYLANLNMEDNFSDSYIPRTLPNEKFVLLLQKNGKDGAESIFREHHTSINSAQEAMQEILSNKQGFIEMLKSKGQIDATEADMLSKELDERAFKTYHIKEEKDYFDELGRKLGYFDLQRILNQIGASKDTKEIEQINNYLQNQMLNRRFEERKGIAGGSEKLDDVFQSLKDLNSELSRRNSNSYMQLEISDLLKSYDKVVDPDSRAYIQSLAKQMLRTTKAENSAIAGIRNVTYGALMFNPRQWITNATGLLSTGLPVLARYHHARALPELFNNFQQGIRLLKAYKMEEAGKGLPELQGEDVAMYPIFKTFAKSGFINPVLTEEQMTGETNAQRQVYKTSQKVLGFGNIQVEEINRATALLAGYKIAMVEAEKLVNEGKMNESEAEKYAYSQANLINAQINVVPGLNTPLALQKSRGVLRTLLKNQYMMKSFTHNYMHMYSQALKYGVTEGLKGSDKFDKGQLWSFAFANLPMLMLAGVGGVPFSSDMQNIVRGLFKKDTEVEMRKFMATLPGILSSPEFGDFMMNGMPTLAGVDISKSTGMGDVLAQTGLGEVVDMLTGLNSFKSQQSILGGLKAGVDIPASTAGTLLKMMQGDWKAIVDNPPLQTISMIRNLTTAVKQSQQGVQTYKGDTLIKPEGLNAGNLFGEALGFHSVKATNAKEAKTAMDMISGDRSSAVIKFGKEMQDALFDSYKGDSSTKKEVFKAVEEWNKDNAEYGRPIMMRSIILSAINKIKNDKKALRERGGRGYLKYLFDLYNVN